MLKLALPNKGRLADETRELFDDAGLPVRARGERALSASLGGEFEAMDDARSAEAFGICVSIGDIVAVSQKNVAKTALFGKAARQVFHKAW